MQSADEKMTAESRRAWKARYRRRVFPEGIVRAGDPGVPPRLNRAELRCGGPVLSYDRSQARGACCPKMSHAIGLLHSRAQQPVVRVEHSIGSSGNTRIIVMAFFAPFRETDQFVRGSNGAADVRYSQEPPSAGRGGSRLPIVCDNSWSVF